MAGSASATTVTLFPTDAPLPAGQVMIADFDNPLATGFTFTQDANAFTRDGALGLDPGVSAPPPGDATIYETVTANGSATLTSVTPLRAFSFYLGSPDTYNSVQFTGPGGFTQTLSGADIWGAAGGANGDQNWGRRVSYDFTGGGVTKIQFLSGGNSFEFDDLAGLFAVPEPAAWALMIAGFSGVGVMMRRRRALMA
jgi:hypothetical protein